MKIKRKKEFTPRSACPCGSGKAYADCCKAFHDGEVPTTPEALMRSRYAAYARGLVDYIIDTTDPLGSAWDADMTAWVERIKKFAQKTTFGGVKIHETSVDGDRGVVKFSAKLTKKLADISFSETSQFVRRDGRWLYSEGEIH